LLTVTPDVLPDAAPIWAQPALPTLLEKTTISARTGNLAIAQINPIIAGEILHQAQENRAAQEAKDLWFKPLLPATRYTLDVVAGPCLRSDREGRLPGSLYAIFTAPDAIGVLAALKAYYAYEDSLTTLQRVQFATSHYATFTAQMTNAMNQLVATPGATPIRNYIAAADPVTWLSTVGPEVIAYAKAGMQYLADHNSLASLVSSFYPLADDRQPGLASATNGAAALVNLRQKTAADWSAHNASAPSTTDSLPRSDTPRWRAKPRPSAYLTLRSAFLRTPVASGSRPS
jgi:hypothetical protein